MYCVYFSKMLAREVGFPASKSQGHEFTLDPIKWVLAPDVCSGGVAENAKSSTI
jgi:hypothetical protein